MIVLNVKTNIKEMISVIVSTFILSIIYFINSEYNNDIIINTNDIIVKIIKCLLYFNMISNIYLIKVVWELYGNILLGIKVITILFHILLNSSLYIYFTFVAGSPINIRLCFLSTLYITI